MRWRWTRRQFSGRWDWCIYLFGTSQGGMIALETALICPERIKKMVIGSASACMKAEQYRTVDDWIRLAKSGNQQICICHSGKPSIRILFKFS